MSAARVFLSEAIRQRDIRAHGVITTEHMADAALMLSELVTNAVRYAYRLLLLEITLNDGMMRVAVVDDAPAQPTLRAADQQATNGRGLQIVNTLADRWGTTRGAGRQTVWFEIALP